MPRWAVATVTVLLFRRASSRALAGGCASKDWSSPSTCCLSGLILILIGSSIDSYRSRQELSKFVGCCDEHFSWDLLRLASNLLNALNFKPALIHCPRTDSDHDGIRVGCNFHIRSCCAGPAAYSLELCEWARELARMPREHVQHRAHGQRIKADTVEAGSTTPHLFDLDDLEKSTKVMYTLVVTDTRWTYPLFLENNNPGHWAHRKLV